MDSLVFALRLAIKSAVRAQHRASEQNKGDKEQERGEDDEAAEAVPVEFGELLQVAYHDLAGQLRLALGTDAKRERNLSDGLVRDVAFHE